MNLFLGQNLVIFVKRNVFPFLDSFPKQKMILASEAWTKIHPLFFPCFAFFVFPLSLTHQLLFSPTARFFFSQFPSLWSSPYKTWLEGTESERRRQPAMERRTEWEREREGGRERKPCTSSSSSSSNISIEGRRTQIERETVAGVPSSHTKADDHTLPQKPTELSLSLVHTHSLISAGFIDGHNFRLYGCSK